MTEQKTFARGDRVRQKFPGRAITKVRVGTIVGKAQYRGDWLVKWDDDPSPKPRLIPVYAKDLEPDVDGLPDGSRQ